MTTLSILVSSLVVFGNSSAEGSVREHSSVTSDDTRLKASLEHMVWYHGYTTEEMSEATGLAPDRVTEAIDRFSISEATRPDPPNDGRAVIVPYPGGRHPRIGFLDGAIDPRADTKVSIISPWQGPGYVVIDIPEAVWWDDRLLFLAHTHVPTIWTEAGLELPESPWSLEADHSLRSRRELPNGVAIEVDIEPIESGARMAIRLINGSETTLRGLRAQICALLRGMPGFQEQANDLATFEGSYSVRRSSENDQHWIVLAFEPCHRAWGNAPCPCLHSDPSFPDCPPGESVEARGIFSFVEADDAQQAIAAVEAIPWRRTASRLDSSNP